MQIVFSCYILLEYGVLNHHRHWKKMRTALHSCDTVTEDEMCSTHGQETQLTPTPK